MNESYNVSESYNFFLNSPEPTLKHTSYFLVYDEIFTKFRDKKITFVEIGVLNGGSLFMWKNFFGSESRIIGIDLNPEAKKWESYGFEIFIGNQGDKNFWNETLSLIGKVDIVLDDGGHTYKQQVITVQSTMNSINDGGLIVVEDVQTSYQRGFGPRRYSFVEYTKNMIDKINSRSGELVKQGKKKNNIWSVQTFESIVVFHVNRQKSEVISKRIKNKLSELRSIDYRYLDNKFFKNDRVFKLISPQYRYIFKKLGYLILRMVSYIDAIKSRYYKYFR
jgi:hypothetical protein